MTFAHDSSRALGTTARAPLRLRGAGPPARLVAESGRVEPTGGWPEEGGGLMAGWYLARGTGAATLVLLTLTVVLGIVNVRRWAPRGVQRFLVDDLHRTLGLLVVVLLGVHVASVVLDGFVSISPVEAVVPFVGSYHPFWVGLGALALDMLAALIVTSLLRARLGLRAWRAVHWLAYACWPVALAHGVGMGTDASSWLLWTTLACAALVLAAAGARLAGGGAPLRMEAS